MTQANILAQLGSPGISTGFKNRIINGAMTIDQRNAGASVNNGAGAYTYSVDRFAGYGTSASKFTMQQSTTAPTGFVNSTVVTSSAATTPGAGDAYGFLQRIEGTNLSDLAFGTASAKTITVSFWVRSSITGTYAVALVNSSYARCYPAQYTISAANTWEYKTVTIAGDTSGTWLTTTGIGAEVWFDLGSGSNFNGTANSWNGSLKVRTSSSANWIGTSGATLYITGVQLEVGTSATDFEYRPYGTELQLCQRYYQRLGSGDNTNALCVWNPTNVETSTWVQIPVSPMRTIPSVSISGTPINSSGGVVSTDKWAIYHSGTWRGCSAITAGSINISGFRLDAVPNDSITSGGASGLYGGSSCYINFSAEL